MTAVSEDKALFDKGLPIRREVLGADYVDDSLAKADDFMMGFQRATTAWAWGWAWGNRSEEHTSALQSLMRISYAVFCLKKNTNLTLRCTCKLMTQQRTQTLPYTAMIRKNTTQNTRSS